MYVNRLPVPGKPSLENSFCTQIMLKVTKVCPRFFKFHLLCAAANLRSMKFSRYFDWVLKFREIIFFNKTARFCIFYDICKSFVHQEQSQNKLKQWPFGNLGIGISHMVQVSRFFWESLELLTVLPISWIKRSFP